MLKDMKPIIEHTIMQKYYNDKTNKLISYRITPEPGYKLHHSALDVEVVDDVSYETTGEIELGFTESFIQINKNYDFNINTDDIYTIKKEEGNNGW